MNKLDDNCKIDSILHLFDDPVRVRRLLIKAHERFFKMVGRETSPWLMGRLEYGHPWYKCKFKEVVKNGFVVLCDDHFERLVNELHYFCQYTFEHNHTCDGYFSSFNGVITDVIDNTSDERNIHNYLKPKTGHPVIMGDTLNKIGRGPRGGFKDELIHLINSQSIENGSDTPDFILAEYLMQCLNTFDMCVRRRREWYVRCDKAAKVAEE